MSVAPVGPPWDKTSNGGFSSSGATKSALVGANKEKLIGSLELLSAKELVQLLNGLIPEARRAKEDKPEDARIQNHFFGDFAKYQQADKLLGSDVKEDKKKALELFAELNEIFPSNKYIKAGLAVSYHTLGKHQNSEALFEEINGDNARVMANYAREMRRIPLSNVRLQVLSRTVDLNRDQSNLMAYGLLLVDKKMWKEAIAIFKELEALDSLNPDVLDKLGESYYNLGKKDIKWADTALSYFNTSLELYPYSSWTYRMISHCYSLKGDYQKAYENSKEAISKGYNAYFSLSWYCLFIGRPEEAIAAAQKYLEMDPSRQTVHTNMVLGYLLSEDFETAERIYKEWKNKQWPQDDDRYETYKEAFLDDLSDLESSGIIARYDFAREWLDEE